MKYAINQIQYIEGPREAEFQIQWRIIMQVGASYMRKSESTHFLPFSLVALYSYCNRLVILVLPSVCPLQPSFAKW